MSMEIGYNYLLQTDISEIGYYESCDDRSILQYIIDEYISPEIIKGLKKRISDIEIIN